MKHQRRRLHFLLLSDWSELPSHLSVLLTRGLLHPAAHQSPARALRQGCLPPLCLSLLLPKRPDGVLVKFSSSVTLRGLCLVPKLHLIVRRYEDDYSNRKSGDFALVFFCVVFFLTSHRAGVHEKGAFSRRRSCFPASPHLLHLNLSPSLLVCVIVVLTQLTGFLAGVFSHCSAVPSDLGAV